MTISASANSLAKLEPFLLLAKSAKGAAAAKLITEATASPGCYVFSELFNFEGIKELSTNEQYQEQYRLLELFAYGDMKLYKASTPGTFPTLSQNHISKLRHLTLVSLASRSRVLQYSSLIRDLDLRDAPSTSNLSVGGPSSHISAKDIRALEDVIIDAIYAGILSARLDQRKQRVEVESVMGRDVRGTKEVGELSTILEQWSTTTTQLLASLSARIEQARKSDEDKSRQKVIQDDHLRSILTQLANTSSNSLGGGMTGFGGAGISKSNYDRLGSDRLVADMEMDDDTNGIKKKKSSAGGPMRSKRSRA